MAYVAREAWILSRVQGKRILHLGVVGMTDEDEAIRLDAFERSFHTQLAKRASEIVGVDISADIIASLTEQGVSGLYPGNVETLDESPVAGEAPFDAVVIGDLIEHLSNPGLMLDRLAAFLRPNGEIIVTTPNAFSLPAHLRFIAGKFREGEQHSLSFNIFTLENLLARHGWRITERHTSYQAYTEKRMKRLPFILGRWFFRRFSRVGGTLLITAEPTDSTAAR